MEIPAGLADDNVGDGADSAAAMASPGAGHVSAARECILSVRIVQVDYYLDKSKSGGPRKPVLRIFGPTAAGQKACVHLHGVFPYFYCSTDSLGLVGQPTTPAEQHRDNQTLLQFKGLLVSCARFLCRGLGLARVILVILSANVRMAWCVRLALLQTGCLNAALESAALFARQHRGQEDRGKADNPQHVESIQLCEGTTGSPCCFAMSVLVARGCVRAMRACVLGCRSNGTFGCARDPCGAMQAFLFTVTTSRPS